MLGKTGCSFPQGVALLLGTNQKDVFTTTCVLVNYTLKHHKDPDLLYSGIGWFIQGNCFPVAKLPFFSCIPSCIIVEKNPFTL
jgi:hypothetical protein